MDGDRGRIGNQYIGRGTDIAMSKLRYRDRDKEKQLNLEIETELEGGN